MRHADDLDVGTLRNLAWTFMASSLLLVLITSLN